jgi:hypothetical protein
VLAVPVEAALSIAGVVVDAAEIIAATEAAAPAASKSVAAWMAAVPSAGLLRIWVTPDAALQSLLTCAAGIVNVTAPDIPFTLCTGAPAAVMNPLLSVSCEVWVGICETIAMLAALLKLLDDSGVPLT